MPGGGEVDVDGWSAAHRRTVARCAAERRLRGLGAEPDRGRLGCLNAIGHIHAVAISDPDLAPEAQAQVGDYCLGRNRLKNRAFAVYLGPLLTLGHFTRSM